MICNTTSALLPGRIIALPRLSIADRLRRCGASAFVLFLVAFAPFAVRVEAQVSSAASPAATLQIDRFILRYGLEHPQLPAVAELEKTEVSLSHDGQTWRGDGKVGRETVRLQAIPQGSLFDREALSTIAESLVH